MTTEVKLHIRQPGDAKDSTSSKTWLWKITVLPLYYYHILVARKLEIIDSNETKLDGTNNVIAVG